MIQFQSLCFNKLFYQSSLNFTIKKFSGEFLVKAQISRFYQKTTKYLNKWNININYYFCDMFLKFSYKKPFNSFRLMYFINFLLFD